MHLADQVLVTAEVPSGEPGQPLLVVLLAQFRGGGGDRGRVDPERAAFDGDVGGLRGAPAVSSLDGALMLGTTAACNPSITIAAVAERATDDLIAQYASTVL